MTAEQSLAAIAAWRSTPIEDQHSYFDSVHAQRLDPVLAAAIANCSDRGSELSVSAYPEGCCPGPTLHECRAGKGSSPGKVTSAECRACKSLSLEGDAYRATGEPEAIPGRSTGQTTPDRLRP